MSPDGKSCCVSWLCVPAPACELLSCARLLSGAGCRCWCWPCWHLVWANRHEIIGSSLIQGHPWQGVIDRNGQLSGSVMKCLHLSGFGRERGYGRLNPPAIDSSSSKRYISEEKLCLPSPEGRNRAAGNCLCSLGEHQPGEQLCCLPAGLVASS